MSDGMERQKPGLILHSFDHLTESHEVSRVLIVGIEFNDLDSGA